MKNLLFALSILLLATSCKTTANLNKAGNLGKDGAKAYAFVNKKALDFIALEAKGSADYKDNDQKIGFTYRLRINKGQAVWMTVSKLGFEGARLKADTTGVRIINRTQSELIELDYTCLSKKVGMHMDYHTLENILVGNFPLKAEQLNGYGNENDASFFAFATDIATGRIFTIAKLGRVDHIEAELRNKTMQTLLSYTQYRTVENDVQVPFSLILNVTGTANMNVQLKHKRVKFSSNPLSVSFNVPSNYKTTKPC